MKILLGIITTVCASIGLMSCIQDEPLCPEAEIESFTLPSEILFSEPVINQGQNTIQVLLNSKADLTALAPEVTVNEYSTVSPASGETVDFTNPVTYRVTAQDGIHTRDYQVQVIVMNTDSIKDDLSIMKNFDFSYWEENSTFHYQTPVQKTSDGVTYNIFSTSNQGVALYQQFSVPEKYPTFAIEHNGGYAAKMITKEGPGNILGLQYIPIVAGSLYTGTMNLLNALKDPLTATQLGKPFNQIPVRFTGYYKYKAGSGDYIGPDGKPRPGVKDSCAVYAVFYQVDDTLQILDGTNVHSHPNIILQAMLPDRSSTEGNDLQAFDIEFKRLNDKVIDFSKHEYKLAVVFSSSFWGDRYEGTPGSELIIDDVKIITENDEKASLY